MDKQCGRGDGGAFTPLGVELVSHVPERTSVIYPKLVGALTHAPISFLNSSATARGRTCKNYVQVGGCQIPALLAYVFKRLGSGDTSPSKDSKDVRIRKCEIKTAL